MADSTAMTIDFLRARLLSERSVSRAAKERADQLAMRVAELEEQVRAVTAQRRQAERATAEVLAILESQGFGGHLSDVVDSGSDHDGEEEEEPRDAKSGGDNTARSHGEKQEPAAAKGEAEDALSGTAQPGGLSWKGRSVSPRKARQLKQKHRRSYFYVLSSDSSPKYRVGQSCRKNKRKELRSAAPEEEAGNVVLLAESQKRQKDGSDCTDDGQADLDGEVGGDERSSGDGGGQYVIRYEKDEEMERVLERQAELIGQYEAEEEAQREWEEQFNEIRNSSKGDVKVENKAYQLENGQEANCGEEEKSCDKNLPSISNPSAGCMFNGSLSESPQNASEQGAARQREAHEEHGQDSAQIAAISAQGSSDKSTVTRQNQEQGDENSDGCSSCHTNARSSRHRVIQAPSDGSPSSDTLISKVSDWSSSHFHDHADNQLDTQSYRQSSSNVDVGSVLEALHRAKISLREKLSRPVPPCQVTLALPAPGDDRTEEDFPVDDEYNSGRDELCSSSPSRQEILALPAPEDYHDHGTMDFPANDVDISLAEQLSRSSPLRQEILALPAPGDDYQSEIEDGMNIPITVSSAGLFRLPTDSFPKDETLSSSINAYDLGFSLRETARHNAFSSNPAAHVAVSPSFSRDDSGFSAEQYYDPHSSVLLTVPASGRCNITSSDLTIGGTSFLSGIPGLGEDLRRGRPLGDADLFMQRGCDYTISNKWML